MKTIETKELREYVIKKYISEDGKEFSTYEECRRHEERMQEQEDEDYINEHAIARWGDDDYSGICGWFGCGGGTLTLITVDDRVIKWARRVDFMNSIEEFMGETVFICGFGDGYYIDFTLEEAIKRFEEDLDNLKGFLRKPSITE